MSYKGVSGILSKSHDHATLSIMGQFNSLKKVCPRIFQTLKVRLDSTHVNCGMRLQAHRSLAMKGIVLTLSKRYLLGSNLRAMFRNISSPLSLPPSLPFLSSSVSSPLLCVCWGEGVVSMSAYVMLIWLSGWCSFLQIFLMASRRRIWCSCASPSSPSRPSTYLYFTHVHLEVVDAGVFFTVTMHNG